MHLSPEDQLLVSVVKIFPNNEEIEKINALIPQITDWKFFTENLIAHGSAPLMYKKIPLLSNQQLIPADVKDKLQQVYYKTMSRSMVLYDGFVKVASTLTEAGIKVIALKGVYLSECLYGDIALRQFSDMDLLVKEEDGERCISLLKTMGFRPFDASVSEFIAEHTEIVHHTPMVKGNLSVEIHIRLHRKSKQYEIQTADFIKNAVPVKIQNTNVFALRLYDLLIHLCVHIDKHFAGGHIQMKCFNDIVNLLSINEKKMDWNEFTDTCKHNKCEKLVMKYLMMTHEFYNTPLPEYICTKYIDILSPYDKNKFIEYLHGVEEKKYHVSTHWQNMTQTAGWSKKFRYFAELIFPPKSFMLEKYRLVDSSKLKVNIEQNYKQQTTNYKLIFWWLFYPYRWWVGLKGIWKLLRK